MSQIFRFLQPLFFIAFSTAAPVFAAAKITLVNSNQQCSGFNDPRPAANSGGNYGTTLGQQRLNAFQYAANLIAQHLNTSVEIKVDAQMNALGGSAYSAVLGQAGPMSVARDFSGAPVGNTYYPIALAETLYGADLNNGSDIVAEFNSDLDTSEVLGSIGWYYGLDQGGGAHVDYVTVIQHELLHGLGFLSLLDAAGKKLYGRNDSFLLHLEDHGQSPADLKSMTDSQRAVAITDHTNLHWTGPQVVANSGSLSGGVDSNQHVYMYAPSSYKAGSSVSHFSTLLSPSEVMEPYYTGPDHEPGLAIQLLKDIGWTTINGSGSADLHLALSDSGNHQLGESNSYTLVISNNGSATARGVLVTYMLPHGHDFVSAIPSAGSCQQANRIITCAIGDISHMDSKSLTVVARMKAAGSQTHAAIASSATSESNRLDNRVFKTTTINGSTNLALSISPQTGNFAEGGEYLYTATATNSGASTATGVAIRFDLPAGLSFASAEPGSCCYASGSSISCHQAELDSKRQVDFKFTLRATQSGTYSAKPYVSLNQTDSNPDDNGYGVNVNISPRQEKDNCFIATAAYGSLLHRHVKWLRLFRDRYLLSHSAGKVFVRLYYRYSPWWADKIRQSDFLRALVRGSLGPLVVLSRWLTDS